MKQTPVLLRAKSEEGFGLLLAEKTIGDTKSHFELTLTISKKLAEMQKICKLASFITQFG